jgi:hypothetical protein
MLAFLVMSTVFSTAHLAPETAAFYRSALEVLNRAGIPFLVGGAYALGRYTGIERHTKDFDIFVRPGEAQGVLDALHAGGYHTELTFPHWLGKAYHGTDFIDVIYSSGNGVAMVDDVWFEHAAEGVILGLPLRLIPAEEMIWSKAFILERERFDGADIAHLLRARAAVLDWQRLLQRFDRNWRVLYVHLVLFGYVYPAEQAAIPGWVMEELTARLRAETTAATEDQRVCQGTLLSRAQYLIDINSWGYEDARLRPDVHMNEADIAHWTAAIEGGNAHVDREDVAQDSRGR